MLPATVTYRGKVELIQKACLDYLKYKEPLVLLPILTMQLMEIAVSPITSMVGTGKNTTESTFPSILIATAHA